MSDQGAARPRRALAPLPDEDDDLGEDSSPGSSQGQYPFDDTSSQTTILRRLALTPTSPQTPPSPASPSRSWAPAGTPVPPPRPVLPDQYAGMPTSAGRRFSASTSPSEVASLPPRRSATSVSSPPSAFPAPSNLQFRGFVGPSVPAPAPEPEPEPAPPSAPSAPAKTRHGKGRAFGVIGIVLVVVALVAAGVYFLRPQAAPVPGPSASTSSTPPAPLDPVLTTTDVAGLLGATWMTATSATATEPLCLPAASGTVPAPDRTARRVLGPQNAGTDTITHVVDTYADAAAAARAYTARLAQAGSCAGTTALLTGSFTITGLADAAAAATLDIQDDPVQHHTLVISQTGRNVSMIDLTTQAAPPKPAALAAIAAKPLARLCSAGEGTCPASIAVKDSVPAAGDTPGWLIEADLPRINVGDGRWKATAVSSTPTVSGSQCETVDLVKVTGATVTQRTLLLADDPAQPTGFGVDQVNYSFTNADAAKKYQGKLNDGLADCDPRVPTAKVADGPTTKGIGANSVAFSGKSYRITQQTQTDANVSYRVAVLRAGKTVTYLLVFPATPKFDFTDDQWKALMLRAGQRASALP